MVRVLKHKIRCSTLYCMFKKMPKTLMHALQNLLDALCDAFFIYYMHVYFALDRPTYFYMYNI